LKAWPADKVERRSIASLVPYARNARMHSAEQIDQIAASICEWGWTVPVLVDEADGIIAGHGRVLAAHKLAIAEVPVMVAAGWSEAQKRAYVLADNKLALNAGWDNDLLKIELGDLQAFDFDLGLIGFSADEIAGLTFDRSGLTDPDEAPEAPAIPVSELGDVWLLGRHRLVCGDCTDPLVVDKALNGVKPHLLISDPPYGVDYDPSWRNEAGVSATARTGKVTNDDRADWREAWALFLGDVAYVWHAGMHAKTVAESLEATGFAVRSQIIWSKPRFVLGRGDYHWQHEPCFYAVRKSATGHWQGARDQSTVWTIGTIGDEDEATVHATQKPVECMKRPIENNSSPGQAVYDPFVGSGTTIIAAEMTGRACHAVELHPAYVDVVVTRWQNFTGQTATLEATGETFAERLPKAELNGGRTAGKAPARAPEAHPHAEGS
jgi:DNA modification methylase